MGEEEGMFFGMLINIENIKHLAEKIFVFITKQTTEAEGGRMVTV